MKLALNCTSVLSGTLIQPPWAARLRCSPSALPYAPIRIWSPAQFHACFALLSCGKASITLIKQILPPSEASTRQPPAAAHVSSQVPTVHFIFNSPARELAWASEKKCQQFSTAADLWCMLSIITHKNHTYTNILEVFHKYKRETLSFNSRLGDQTVQQGGSLTPWPLTSIAARLIPG